MLPSIIVPMYGRWNLTMARLIEFREHLAQECEIVVVDDATPAGEEKERIRNGMAFWQKSGTARLGHVIRFIVNEENLGFGGSMNRGASRASGDVLIFYSNDVVASGDFLSPLTDLFKQRDDKILIGHRMIYWAAGWNEFNLGKPKIIPYLEGYFIACRKEEWEELGGWDTRYGKYDYEDMDLSAAATVLGYNLIEFSTPVLRHMGGSTIPYSESRMENTKRNREIFIEKWRDILSE